MDDEKIIDAEFEEVTQEPTDTIKENDTPQASQGANEPPHSEGGDIKEGDANSKDSIDRTRSIIAFRFIIGFFGVVFLVFVTGWSGIFKDSDFKDLLLTISGTLSSALGFIIGYYFKSSEDNKKG